MKISIPESLEDITLEQYQKYMQLDAESKDYEAQVFCLFTGLDLEYYSKVPQKDINDIVNQITKALESEGEFKQTFFINGVEFGLIPNFDKITGGEYSDLIIYSKKEENGYNHQLDRLIAVLYRPITNKDKLGNYQIEIYKGTSGHLKYIQKLPISIVNGCLSFFLTLSEQLENHIQACMVEEQLKVN